MSDPSLRSLLNAVRRHLWRGQFVAAARLALWLNAGLMLLAATVHLLAHPVSIGALSTALAVPWAVLVARAGWRRPSERASALWADQHLGGASAFTTWLETSGNAPGAADAQALQWLERWVKARVPQGLERLATLHESARLSRPLLSALVCAALATFVLTLAGPAPGPRPQAASRPASGIAERPGSDDDTATSPDRTSEVAMALRAVDPDAAPERNPALRAQATGSAPATAGRNAAGTDAPPSRSGAATPDPRSIAEASTVGTATPPTAPPGAATAVTAATPAAGAGRDAGDSRDGRADIGESPAPRLGISVQRSATEAARMGTERRADMDRLATYDDDPSAPGAAAGPVAPAPAAATPPAATAGTRLSVTETNYVQAWLTASGRPR